LTIDSIRTGRTNVQKPDILTAGPSLVLLFGVYLSHFIINPESVRILKFEGDNADDEVIVEGLKMELHMTAMHCIESFFRMETQRFPHHVCRLLYHLLVLHVHFDDARVIPGRF